MRACVRECVHACVRVCACVCVRDLLAWKADWKVPLQKATPSEDGLELRRALWVADEVGGALFLVRSSRRCLFDAGEKRMLSAIDDTIDDKTAI